MRSHKLLSDSRKKVKQPPGSGPPAIDFLVNPKRAEERDTVATFMRKQTESLFDPTLLEKAFPALFRLLQYTQLPCIAGDPSISPGHLLQTCYWMGRPINCSSLFTPTITDQGICCSFNLQQNLREEDCSSEEGERKFSCLVKELQGEGSNGEEVRKATVGADMGLQLVLDQHSNLNSLQTLHEPGQGLKLLIGQPNAFPLLGQDSLLLAPGRSHHLRLDATLLASTDAVASLHPTDRECLFPSERSLQHHPSYSQARFARYAYRGSHQHLCCRWLASLSVDLPMPLTP